MASNECELCERPGGEVLVEDVCLRVVLVDDPDYPGFCRVIWNEHVKEMSDLPFEDRSRLFETVVLVEKVIREVLEPDKVNLASLGNVVPHLHWHVIPRFRDDRCFPSPIWATPVREAAPRALPDRWKETLREALVDHLNASRADSD